MNTLIAYHNNAQIKADILAQLQRHFDADELVKGRYWEGGKGCAVGCTIYSGNHMEYQPRFGIPVAIARLEDQIFEGLPNEEAKLWPLRLMTAIQPGQDLSRVVWWFLHWLLTDATVNPGIAHPLVKDAVAQCAEVVCNLAKGNPLDASATWSAASAERAAWSAQRARRAASAESAAWSAESAAWSAQSAAWSAQSAAWSAWSAWRAASAESAAWSAQSAAWSAWRATSAAYIKMADMLIALIEQAPLVEPRT